MTTALSPRQDVRPYPPAAQLSDAELRVELATTHAVGRTVIKRGIPRDRAMLQIRLDELDGEYLRRFPAAAATWPWNR
ncbi:DUF6158 family protein [Catellatospora sp. NPDC049111]|jgi:hypothetical protein|uniref:DUF6158 family protein n=1 Tax=unclassified Catellatospora TaxID=2645785 RepID=UPI0033EA8115